MCNKWKIPLVRIIHHTSQSHQPKISWEGANDPNAVDLYFSVLGWQPKKKAPWMGIVKNIPVHGALFMKTKYFLLINATYLFTVYLQLFQ